ncbi:MAG: hypothetical protein ACAI43_26340, partial [Phycisphaerae bacterium]
CLAKDPAERYRHVGDLRMDLRDARLARAWERRDATPGRAAALRRWLPWAVAACAVIAAVTWRLGSPDRAPTATAPAPPAAPVHRFDVTFPADAVQGDLERVQLALSPDGREWVVACKTPAGGQALWARAHRDGAWRRVERSDGGHRPVFSPDGQWVTFYRDGHLFKHRTAGGGDPIRLAATTNWYGADWTADGALVFCTAWGTPLQFLGPAEAKPRPCTKIDAARGDVSHIGPAVVPGGRWLLYNAWPGGEVTDIYAAELAAGAPGEPHVVVANASTPKFASTPRGEYLLFERGSIIFAAPFDRATARVTGPETAVAEGVLNDGTRFAAYFDVAADGTLAWIPGASFAEESRLAYVNADGTTTPVNDDRMSFCEPSFSPAGGRMAVLVKGKVYRALVYDLASQTREFLVTGGDTLSHAMSPDGQTLACTVNRDGGYGVDLISLADGRRIGRIVEPAADYMSDLSWSADGKVITFSMTARQGVPNDIWIVDARAGATPRPLVSTAGADTKPAICPTANWVAYASDVSGRAEIYLVSYPDGTTTRQITFGGGMRPAWSPDGRTLYFVGPKGLTSVKVTPGGAVAGQPQIVYDKPFGQSDPIAREYAVATDGRILIVEPSERRPTVSHIKVITNWHRLLP